MKFFVGLDDLHHARHFERCMVSANRLRDRKSGFAVQDWIMDSGAFTELSRHGHYRHSPQDYAEHVIRWAGCGTMLCAVSQDYMCEPFILDKTGLSVADHQRLTIERYDELQQLTEGRVYIMPVLQGYWPDQYLAHIDQYGQRLALGAWAGVGSVCKRNVDVEGIESVLVAIRRARPDLLLHGFGVKTTAMKSSLVRECLYSADSMAWSFAARQQGRDAHDWHIARAFVQRIENQTVKVRSYQETMPFAPL